jgi:hypothetical protein
VNLGLLFRRQFALDAHEAPARAQSGAEVPGIDVGKHARHLLVQFVDIDDLGGIGEERGALDVGGKQPAVAVENVGTMDGGGNVEQSAAALRAALEAERDQAAADQ